MKRRKLGLLAYIVIAIALGIVGGYIFPLWLTRLFATLNSVMGELLSFFIPLIIIGLIVPSIASLGNKAARLLGITALLSYAFTIVSGMMTWGACAAIYPSLLADTTITGITEAAQTAPYFTIDIPPLMNVMSALVASFILGVGITLVHGEVLGRAFDEFGNVVKRAISTIIVPALPVYIFTIFLDIAARGQVASVLGTFLKLIVVIFIMTVVLLLLQFIIAGIVARRNPLTMLRTMLRAYLTALGTQSSAATIPVTLEQVLKLGVRPDIANFTVPLCATIHLSGSTLKITACALAIMTVTSTMVDSATMVGFILLLGVTMVAAPGVPGGAIMASIGLLQASLGFDDTMIGLMIALYIAMDSFGTATNVMGDGAIAAIVNRIAGRRAE